MFVVHAVRVRARSLVLLVAGAAVAHADPDPLTPPADQASGVAVAAPRKDHGFANTLLAVPRAIVLFLLEGPRYAASELDDYLENRSPNAFGRDAKQASWRLGATVEWQTELGTSVALRIGYQLASATTIDAYGGLFGPRGQSGGLHANLGRYTAARIKPSLSFDAGRDLTRAFAGVGEHGPRATYDQQGFTVGAGLAAHAGPVRFGARGTYDSTRAADPSADFAAYPMLVGFDEDQRASTGELSVTLDLRSRRTRWIQRSAPSSGFYLRAAGGYTAGTASRSGDFTLGRAAVEARQLFDLFHGDRVLSIGARYEAITANAMDVPFERVPTLGGRDTMRAYAMGELRDRDVAAFDIQYEWPVSVDLRSYVFIEAGHAADWHGGYGGGIRYLTSSGTGARLQLAGSESGDLGAFVQFGAL
ncbi:MAG: hypothetical protein M4D80_21420 [Myxococcota bacterium]|nr:hypothetical protein [Myxococcota bacterium]